MSERKLTYDRESESKKERTTARPTVYARAKNIVSTKRIHQGSNGNIWLVESETSKKFYCVKKVEDIYSCDCPHFTYANVAACKHIIACLFRIQAKSMLRESN